MQRLSLRTWALPATQRAHPTIFATAPRLAFQQAQRSYASSSPKEAEEASAQSGGSRSKDAVEESSSDTTGTLGRTGGGEPLKSSKNAPPQPKIHNASIPGEGSNKLSKEQQEEVDRHNADFEKKHDRASPAAEDKVNKTFWKGTGGREQD